MDKRLILYLISDSEDYYNEEEIRTFKSVEELKEWVKKNKGLLKKKSKENPYKPLYYGLWGMYDYSNKDENKRGPFVIGEASTEEELTEGIEDYKEMRGSVLDNLTIY